MLTNLLLKSVEKKAVSFNTLETIERNSDRIDKLTSMVSKMNVKWTSVMLNISSKFIKAKEEDRTNIITDKTIINLETDYLVETETEIAMHHIEVEDILTEIIDQITEVDVEIILGMTIGRTITGKIIGETILEITTGNIGI